MEEHELTLEDFGWNPRFAVHIAAYSQQGLQPARVVFEGRSNYEIITEYGEMPAVVTGKMLHASSEGKEELPVIGDWVAVDILDEVPRRAVMYAILPRSSVFSRKEPGSRVREQPVAANIDTVFITMGLDNDYRLSRVERYLTLAWESGAMPVVLLTKSDLCADVPNRLEEVERIAPGVAVYAISTVMNTGMEQLDAHLSHGRTVALLGSSGVGKSTIINYLMGNDVQKVNVVRDDDSKGRHTTTNRRIFVVPSGALVVDTPGMRELQLWNASDGVGETFSDIQELASNCRFPDCRHESEPGCAVLAALDEGMLDSRRMESYRKLVKELEYLELKQETSAVGAERAKWKQIHKQIRRFEHHK